MSRRIVALPLLSLLAPFVAHAADLLILHARLVDGTGRPPIERASEWMAAIER
ncbi:MAG: hypothetical protein ACREQY_06765 [Candidatus Binatia bacterium]